MFALGLILGILATLGVLFVLGACVAAGKADELIWAENDWYE